MDIELSKKLTQITGLVHLSCFKSFTSVLLSGVSHMCSIYTAVIYCERCFYQLCNIFIRPFVGLLVIHSTALTIEPVLKETTN